MKKRSSKFINVFIRTDDIIGIKTIPFKSIQAALRYSYNHKDAFQAITYGKSITEPKKIAQILYEFMRNHLNTDKHRWGVYGYKINDVPYSNGQLIKSPSDYQTFIRDNVIEQIECASMFSVSDIHKAWSYYDNEDKK